ncbi:hypothetical protein E6W36_03440 [Hankyongella ginsenosidimutans]|uniref:Uncharacterized protein n=1 Tax=Hankyongella ginsenosidimutans TaxID=1763828 RepID=A0A4D7BTT1_9SPHN|nr:hypothetical protein [Hankyongella ginsenosidimutans]QCI78979.1 hypothetical protein E6W36_03440 [Hankyongella ginsenosidimutans]
MAAGSLLQDIDAPLMPGLAERPDLGFAFDVETGRIARIVLEGPASPDAVLRYYAQALTALGWTADPATESFLRDGERAQLHVESAEPGARIVIDIQPVAQPAR